MLKKIKNANRLNEVLFWGVLCTTGKQQSLCNNVKVYNMKRLFLLVFLMKSCVLLGQEFTITDFSDKFYAKIILNDGQRLEVFKEGKISIFRKIDDVELFSIESNTITIDIEEKFFNKKTIDIPAEKQSTIIYTDFDFDGKNDFAICTDWSSKGPAYSIFLFKDSEFIFDSEFTKIIQSSQGNFDLNPDNKSIWITSSGGCCYRSFSSFSVVDGRPKLVEETILESDFVFQTTTTRKWSNSEVEESVERTIDLEQEGITEIISFYLLKNPKRLVLYNINDRTLNYVLIVNENIPEFFFPIKTIYKNRDFIVNNLGNEISFVNEDVHYKIYQKTKNGVIVDIGINVKVKEKQYDLKGDINTLKGSIEKAKILKLYNVYEE